MAKLGEINTFWKICSNEDVSVGTIMKFANGDEGKITSIRSVKFLTMSTVEVIGRAKITKLGAES